MSNKAYMGTRVPEEKKKAFLQHVQRYGLDQSSGLERAIDEMLAKGGMEGYDDYDPPEMEVEETDDYGDYDRTEMEVEETDLDNGDDDEADDFTYNNSDMDTELLLEDFPLLSERIDCEVKNAWRDAQKGTEEAAKQVLFLEGLSNRLYELTFMKTEYSCAKVNISVPQDIIELVEEIRDDALAEAQYAGDKEELLTLMSNLAGSKAEQLYSETRDVVMSFSRSEWKLIDRMLERENSGRASARQYKSLRDMLYGFLAQKVREHSSAGFFNSAEPEMTDLANQLKNIAESSKKRSYE